VPVERVDIQELTDAYLKCRAYGHDWDDFPAMEVDSFRFTVASYVEGLQCTRCHTERIMYFDHNMHRMGSPYYRKPPRYNTIVGQGTRPNVRFEMLKRGLIVRPAGTVPRKVSKRA
jgi:hypothetical protein